MTITLTDRYVAAAVRTVPEKNRADLAEELRASIDDAVEARVDSGETRADAERAVLSDLGDPDALAAGYTDRPLYVVGPRYFLDWLRLIKVLFAIVLPIAVAAVVLAQLLSQASVGQVIGTAVVSALTISLHLLFWPTVVFAILERTPGMAQGPLAPWSVERLPEPRTPGVGIVELVASLVYIVLLAGALLWDRFVGFVPGVAAGIPVVAPAAWSWAIPVLFVVLAGEAVFAVALFRTGRWTPLLATLNAVLALGFAVPILVLTQQGSLLNPAFLETVSGADAAEVAQIVSIVVACTTIAIALWDVVDGIVKARRDRETPRRAVGVGAPA